MPNWCYQNLTVHGKKKDLNNFRELMFHDTEITIPTIESGAIKTTKRLIGLNHFYPMPTELRNTTAGSYSNPTDQAELLAQESENLIKYGSKNWYDWASDHWGTKWGACSIEINEQTNNTLSIYFESAWSPATGLLKKISEVFPHLIFTVTYTEESSAFAGWEIFMNGEQVAYGNQPTELTPKLSRMADALSESTDDELDKRQDEFYEALNDFHMLMSDITEDNLGEALEKIKKQNKQKTKEIGYVKK